MNTTPRCALWDAGSGMSDAGMYDLSIRLELPIIHVRDPSLECAEQGATHLLVRSAEGLDLRPTKTWHRSGIRVDLMKPGVGRKGPTLSRRQALAGAVGRRNSYVLDATAGLGRDTALLAWMGYRVIAIERSLILGELLLDGLVRAREASSKAGKQVTGRIDLRITDSCYELTSRGQGVDAVYLDPMYPERQSSALPKKEIRLVREIVGDDLDAAVLFWAAMDSGVRRVVVKRPVHAPPLAGTPNEVLRSKMVRYDLYLPSTGVIARNVRP